jgi:hypothetical protein
VYSPQVDRKGQPYYIRKERATVYRLAPALGAGRDAAIDPILEFLYLTPTGDHEGRPYN